MSFMSGLDRIVANGKQELLSCSQLLCERCGHFAVFFAVKGTYLHTVNCIAACSCIVRPLLIGSCVDMMKKAPPQ